MINLCGLIKMKKKRIIGKSAAETDLTVGAPLKVIIKFWVPMLLTCVLQQLYSAVDTMIVGQFLGKQALAAVGATGSVSFVIVGFCNGLCLGFVIPVAQQFGAGDYSKMRRYIANGVWTLLGFATGVSVAVCMLCTQILLLIRTPENILSLSYQYIFIIFLGIPITAAYNFLAGILRSLGDSKTPSMALLLASVVNIGFDILSVTVLNMGVAGPAWATILAQGFSALICLAVIIRRFHILRIKKHEWQLKIDYVKKLCKYGIPMGLQFSITGIGIMILQTGVNSLGDDAIAAVAATTKISMFMTSPTDALGSTMATYAGQNLGAQKLDRISKGIKMSLLFGAVLWIVTFIFILLSGKYLMMMFVDSAETVVIGYGVKYITINMLFYFALVLVNVFRLTIQGLGYSTLAMAAGLMEMIGRSIVGVILIPFLGFNGACFSNVAAWLLADIFLIPAYFYVMRKIKKMRADSGKIYIGA